MRRQSLVLGVWLGVACGPVVEVDEPLGSSGPGSSGDSTAVGTTAVTSTSTTAGEVTTSGADGSSSGGVTADLHFPEHCSTIEQDCPLGYKCMPYATDGSYWNDRRCVPIVDEPAAVGEPCVAIGSVFSGEDDCDGTSMCWVEGAGTLEGTCVPFCVGTDEDPTCADSCDQCTIAIDGFITLCFEPCDPLLQDCIDGQACFPVNGSFACAPDESAVELFIGSPCEYVNGCPMGTACMDASTVPGCTGEAWGCCAPFCQVGGIDPCPELLPGSTCTPWFDPGREPPRGCFSAPLGICAAP